VTEPHDAISVACEKAGFVFSISCFQFAAYRSE